MEEANLYFAEDGAIMASKKNPIFIHRHIKSKLKKISHGLRPWRWSALLPYKLIKIEREN
jgi:hypothetical protein